MLAPDELAPPPALHAAVAKAFRTLDESGVTWLLLRGEDDLLRPSGDVDLLVDSAHESALDDLMGTSGFRRLGAAGHGSHRFYFSYADRVWVKLDIVSDLSFGPLQQWRTPWAADVLSRRVRRGPLWLPSTSDQAWLYLLHLVLDKGRVAPERLEAANAAGAVASLGDDIAGLLDSHVGSGAAVALLDVVHAERWGEVPDLAAWMRKAFTARQPGRTRLRAFANRLLRLSGARMQGHAPVVAAMGPDGAGKTTLLHELKAGVPLPIRYVYMGLWGAGPWDSLLQRVPGGRLGKKVFRSLRGGLTAKYHALLGRIVLLDRVPYDTLLPGSIDRTPAGRLSNALALRMGPQPDVLMVLDVPGDVMFARKGEHSAQVLEGWRQGYLQLAKRLPMARVLDANRPTALVAEDALGMVWGSVTPSAPGLDAAAADPEALPLHLWRLLDWRFLLPDLAPHSVGYGGTIGGAMLSALRLVDPQASPIRPGRSADSLFDVVLLSDPDHGLVDAASRALRPGGWVCLRARRSLPGRRSAPHTLAGWRRELERNGFGEVSVYWHAPTLDDAARMVPTSSSRAITDTLALHRSVRFGWAKAAAARTALLLGLFEAAIPQGTVVGRRSGPSGQEAGGELR